MSQPVLFQEAQASGAVFSSDEVHRFRLWRCWGDPTKRVAFIGLNPSTATAMEPDHTVRRCVGFAKRWGFGAFEIVNLFSYRSTDPKRLLAVYPFHGDDDAHILACLKVVQRVVMAWGSHRFLGPNLTERADHVRRVIREEAPGVEVGHLGLTSDGQPRHPARLANATPFQQVTA